MSAPPVVLQSSVGRTIRLGREIGKGGEGAVYEAQGQSDYAIKVYWPNKVADRHAKVGAMVAAGWFKSINFVAFPVDVLPMAGDKIKISGNTSLKMTDFKIEPPAPTLGLGALKTGDEVKISFEWILGLKTPAAGAK